MYIHCSSPRVSNRLRCWIGMRNWNKFDNYLISKCLFYWKLFQVPRTRFIILRQTGAKVLALTLENHVWKMTIFCMFCMFGVLPHHRQVAVVQSHARHRAPTLYALIIRLARLGITYFKINERWYCGLDDEPPSPLYTLRAHIQEELFRRCHWLYTHNPSLLKIIFYIFVWRHRVVPRTQCVNSTLHF